MAKIRNTTTAAAMAVGALGLLALLGSGGEAVPVRAGRKKPVEPDEPQPAPQGEGETGRKRIIQPGGAAIVTQPKIIDAVWAVLAERNELALKAITHDLAKLTPELQCYLLAATNRAQHEYTIWTSSIKDFREIARKIANDSAKRQKELDAVFTTAIAAVNVIPGVGQAISAVLALAFALGKLISGILTEGPAGSNAIQIWENRLKDLSFLKDWEGSDAYRGLKLNQRYPTEGQLKRKIDGDLIASRLPEVAFATKYFFTPTLEDYQNVAKSAGLYSNEYIMAAYGFKDAWIVADNEFYPTTAYDIRQYLNGYNLGIAQSPYDTNNEWFNVGYEDGEKERPARVGVELQLWSDKITEGD